LIVGRQLMGAVGSPIVVAIGQRFQTKHVLLAIALVRTVAITVVALQTLPSLALLVVMGMIEGVVAAPIRAIQNALLPSLARTPGELIASNSLTSIGETGAVLVGPAVAGLAIAAFGMQVAVLISAVICFLAVPFLVGLRTPGATPRAARVSARHELATSMRYLKRDRLVAGLLSVGLVAYVFLGTLQVYITEYSIDQLGLGDSGPALMLAVLGAGGLIGGVATAKLAKRTRLIPTLAVSLATLGLVSIGLAAWVNVATALVLMAVAGAAVAFNTVAATTIAQRSIDRDVLGQVLGVEAGLIVLGVGVGAGAAAALAGALDLQLALLVSGVAIIVVAVLSLGLRGLDKRADQIADALAMILRIDAFRPLSVALKSELAARLTQRSFPQKATIIAQGEPGRSFYLVGAGSCDVFVDDKPIRSLSAGDSFGEISLLRDIPRTATVTAHVESQIWELDRSGFLLAISGHTLTESAIDSVAANRLGQ
jgi:predicted MFS family arabinose efflux permease